MFFIPLIKQIAMPVIKPEKVLDKTEERKTFDCSTFLETIIRIIAINNKNRVVIK